MNGKLNYASPKRSETYFRSGISNLKTQKSYYIPGERHSGSKVK